MSRYQGVYEAHQRARFMRPDAGRFLRPGAARWVRPDVTRFLVPGSDPADVFAALDRKFNPSQRRIPRGQPGGGRWTDGEEGGGYVGYLEPSASVGDIESFVDGDELRSVDPDDTVVSFDGSEGGNLENLWITDSDSNRAILADERIYEVDQAQIIRVADAKVILNEFGEPYYQPFGHHEMQRSIYGNWDLSAETQEVFKNSTTGRLPKGRMQIDGELRGHFWDGPHREYKEATLELSNRFLEKNGITDLRKMTPDQARDLLTEIRKSENPAIRDYNRAMRLLSRTFRLGIGRGNQ